MLVKTEPDCESVTESCGRWALGAGVKPGPYGRRHYYGCLTFQALPATRMVFSPVSRPPPVFTAQCPALSGLAVLAINPQCSNQCNPTTLPLLLDIPTGRSILIPLSLPLQCLVVDWTTCCNLNLRACRDSTE